MGRGTRPTSKGRGFISDPWVSSLDPPYTCSQKHEMLFRRGDVEGASLSGEGAIHPSANDCLRDSRRCVSFVGPQGLARITGNLELRLQRVAVRRAFAHERELDESCGPAAELPGISAASVTAGLFWFGHMSGLAFSAERLDGRAYCRES